jgi:hypothetical protein
MQLQYWGNHGSSQAIGTQGKNRGRETGEILTYLLPLSCLRHEAGRRSGIGALSSSSSSPSSQAAPDLRLRVAFCPPELREGIDGYARTNAPRRPRRIRRVGAACCVGREVRGVYSVLMRLAPLGGCRSPSLFLTSSGRFSSLLPVEMQKDVCRIVSDRDLFVLYKYFVY